MMDLAASTTEAIPPTLDENALEFWALNPAIYPKISSKLLIIFLLFGRLSYHRLFNLLYLL